MARKIIDIGAVGNDGTGDSIRDSFRKVNDNFRELYGSLGLGERLTFLDFSDTPDDYLGTIDINISSFATSLLTVNNDQNGLTFKQLVGGEGITIDFGSPTADPPTTDRIIINNDFTNLVQDQSPALGGNLDAGQNRIKNLRIYNRTAPAGLTDGPNSADEAASKSYVDAFISRAGVDHIDPSNGIRNSALGIMDGPLILSRDPIADDDERYGGLIAATKKYVDNSTFGSAVNLYVSTTGVDENPNIDPKLQGSSQSYSFKTVEAALRRAEEMMDDSRVEIGPYKKTLTYGNREGECTLTRINVSPDSGSGFQGRVEMSVDSIRFNRNEQNEEIVGNGYWPGDILELVGGNGERATVEILSIRETIDGFRGGINQFKVLNSGSYTSLPGILDEIKKLRTEVSTTIISSGAPQGQISAGGGALFDLDFKVSGVEIENPGSGYGLVSVRIEGIGGSRAFGTADVIDGEIVGITITDTGGGFINIPSIEADLPRFCIFTDGKRTDSTGITGNPSIDNLSSNKRKRDLREGLYLRGEASGALAQILGHQGDLGDIDGVAAADQINPGALDLYELFDVDVKFGSFEEGEVISFGDITKNLQISVMIESGIYEENLPLKIPQNVAIIGDEFRRSIIKPRQGFSTSSWAFQKFRRDTTVGWLKDPDNLSNLDNDLLVIGQRLYGYHYLQSSDSPIIPKIRNRGSYSAAATLIKLNKNFIQAEMIAWIDRQVAEDIFPFFENFQYDRFLCRQGIGLIIDAITFDLKKGSYNRSVSIGLKYHQNGLSLVGINDQLAQSLRIIEQINVFVQLVLLNVTIPVNNLNQRLILQVVDKAFKPESGSAEISTELNSILRFVITEFDTINRPKNNDQMDVFLCNDANIVRAMSSQGHGGFMMVLDPEGQILAKSPYAQECSSFSKSINTQTFSGGQFVDGFTGNLQFIHESTTYIAGSIVINDGGTGYSVDDILTVIGGLRIAPVTLSVKTVGGTGNITSVSIINSGNYQEPIIDITGVTVSPSGGEGAEVQVIWNPPSRISIKGLDRLPNLPGSIIVNDQIYRVNYVRDFKFEEDQSQTTYTATLVLDESTPFLLPAGRQECTFIDNAEILEIEKNDHNLQKGATLIFDTDDTLPQGMIIGKEYYVLLDGLTGDRFRITDDPASKIPLIVLDSDLGSGTHTYQRIYELITPGNRSMLSNDFTQINDLGYGLVASNGGLIEAVSVFTYYCHVSYYTINGGQIRSVSGSSAHGNYALVAQDSDPLEVPTPTSIYQKNSQGVKCHYPNGEEEFRNVAEGFDIWVRDFDYVPLNNSELEIYHEGLDELIRYPISIVDYDKDNYPGLAKLRIFDQDGLRAQVDDETPMTIRNNNSLILTGDVLNVSVRPSTGLLLNETPIDVYRVLKFESYEDPSYEYEYSDPAEDPFRCNIIGDLIEIEPGTFIDQILVTTSVPHNQLIGYQVSFESLASTPDLPDPLEPSEIYYIVSEDFGSQQFKISKFKNGNPLIKENNGTGPFRFKPAGLVVAEVKENYRYIDLQPREPNEFRDTPLQCTFSIDTGNNNDFIITTVDPDTGDPISHGFNINDENVIRFKISSDNLTDALPRGISRNNHYFVTEITSNTFKIKLNPGSTINVRSPVSPNTGSGIFVTGRVRGIAGDDSFLINEPAGSDFIIDLSRPRPRIQDCIFVWRGEEYVVTDFTSTIDPGDSGIRITLDRNLIDSVVSYPFQVTLRASPPARDVLTSGTLTVRISLTRVTGHDLLDIGTGSYADTNYPNEIYGAPVNPINDTRQTQERNVGRVFYVTTDQFGNVSIGTFFQVDQGTGTATLNAPIAISNLSGLGFKTGRFITEFTSDSDFEPGLDTRVPTERSIKTYIERRLGIRQNNDLVSDVDLIPRTNGGFMALNGLLSMKSNMDLGNNRIININDPQNEKDAVNLRSLTIDNLKGLNLDNPVINQLAILTGESVTNNIIVNATVTGDITFSDLANNAITTSIGSEKIFNSMINNDANINQTKLNISNAYATISGNITATNGSRSGTTATLTFASQSIAPFSAGQRITVTGFTTAGYNGTFTVISGSPTQVTYTINIGTPTPAVGTGTITSLRGISAFDNSQFDATNGWISLKNNGVILSKLAQVNGNTVLGNSSAGVGNVQAIPFSTIASVGGAVLISNYTSTGFLRAAVTTTGTTFTVVDSSAGSSSSFGINQLIRRNNEGDFGGRILDIQELKIENNTVIKRQTTTNPVGGNVRYIGFNSNTGISFDQISNATSAIYTSGKHEFKDGSNYAPIRSSSLTTSAIKAEGELPTSSGTITGRWILDGASRFEATYAADLAEYYEGDSLYAPGTVMIFGGEYEVTACYKSKDTRVAGVVSNTAAYVMYDACPGMKNLIALQGRVPCKVIGKIYKGDLLVTSNIEGTAMSAGTQAETGTVIGKALENYDSDSEGIIQVAVGRN